MWKDDSAVRNNFSLMGNKADYVDTLVAYVNSGLDFFNLWQHIVVGGISDLALVPCRLRTRYVTRTVEILYITSC